MVSRDQLQRQLDRIGCNFRFWGRSELMELANILLENETIAHCVNGNYEGGFALLCATDHRVLLVDKKPLSYLNVQDVRLEMISEFDYSHRLMNATVHIRSSSGEKHLVFSSWNQPRLRVLLNYVQQRVIEIRQYQYMAQQFQAQAFGAFQNQQSPAAASTYAPNMANGNNMAFAAPSQDGRSERKADDSQATLGAYTYAKLPHFRHRNSRHLGKYAMPDEIYPPILN